MIRILILLITLNAIFPVAGIASVCASDRSSTVSMKMHSVANASVTQTQESPQGNLQETIALSDQSHCNDPQMSCNDQTMNSMNCDSGCCVSCLGVSAAMTTASTVLLSPTVSIKPVSGYINFYTRSISPELQPPLV